MWPLRHLIKVIRKHDLTNILTIFWLCRQLLNFFLTILTIFNNFNNFDKLDNFDNFWEFWQFLKFFDNFWQFLTIFDNVWQFLTILKRFDNFWQFLQLRQLRQFLTILKRQSLRLVTFETLITVLTIENLNSWQSLVPDN